MGSIQIKIGTKFTIGKTEGKVIAKNSKKTFKLYPHCNIKNIKSSDIFLAKLSTGVICLVYRQQMADINNS